MSGLDGLFERDADGPPHICAEMSGNHQGALAAALDFVDAARHAVANSLKVQVYRPDTITLDSDREDFRLAPDNDWAAHQTLYRLYEKAHTPWDWIREIFARGARVGLPVLASPFDPTAVDLLEDLGCPVYKIASPEITDLGLIARVVRTGKPVILSTGLAEKDDLDRAVDVVRAGSGRFMILKCVSAYPTPPEAMNLATIPWLSQTYGCPAGLSDHTLGRAAGYAATALGARLIEKHFKLPGDTTSVDAGFSMALDELATFKAELAEVHATVGRPTLEIADIARPSLSGKRSLYVVADVAQGEAFTHANLRSVRPSYGMAPRHLDAVLGRRATRDIARGERMGWDLVQGGADDTDG